MKALLLGAALCVACDAGKDDTGDVIITVSECVAYEGDCPALLVEGVSADALLYGEQCYEGDCSSDVEIRKWAEDEDAVVVTVGVYCKDIDAADTAYAGAWDTARLIVCAADGDVAQDVAAWKQGG